VEVGKNGGRGERRSSRLQIFKNTPLQA